MSYTKSWSFHYLHYLLFSSALLIGMIIKDPICSLWYDTEKTIEYDISERTAAIKKEQDIAALFEKADQLFHANEIDQAVTAYKQIINDDHATILTIMRLGAAAARKEHYSLAEHYYRIAVSLQPSYLQAYIRLGIVQMKLTHYEDALRTFHATLMLDPQCFEALFELSKTYAELGQFDKALIYGQKARDVHPNDVHTHLNLGHTCNKKGETAQAIQHYERAIKVDPTCANAHYNLGYTLRVQREPKKALPHLFRALELQPDYPDAHIALAQAYWTFGDFETAWQHYDWRWKQLGIDPKAFSTPLWDGSPLEGKTILLYAEQGMGDTLQFIRYAQLVKEHGAPKIICKVQKPLETLLQSCPYIDEIVTDNKSTSPIDVQAPLMNLPGIFKTTVDTIPHPVPYIAADPALVQKWAEKLKHDTNIKVGLAWHVLPEHEQTKSPLSRRSVPLSLLTPLSAISGVSFYSLQKFDGLEQVLDLPEDFHVHTYGNAFDVTHGRFMDTAALIENLDVVISVDTSIIHVAGALGKEVWTLLPYSPDCRWDLNEHATPWYGSMRLFRQQTHGDWSSVVAQIKHALEAFVKEKK